MEEFIKWFLENWNANIFTLFTVLLSGIISLIISAAYYRKGNRNNLKMSVIHPIISILNDSYSRNNYKKIEEIAREYSVRYFKKKELKKLNSLLEAYKEISVYNDIQINANSLFSYFEYKLEKEGINTKPFPIEYEEKWLLRSIHQIYFIYQKIWRTFLNNMILIMNQMNVKRG